MVDHGDARFPTLWQDLPELAAQVLDLLVALGLLPAVLLVEEGLPSLVIGEVQGLDGTRRGTQAARSWHRAGSTRRRRPGGAPRNSASAN